MMTQKKTQTYKEADILRIYDPWGPLWATETTEGVIELTRDDDAEQRVIILAETQCDQRQGKYAILRKSSKYQYLQKWECAENYGGDDFSGYYVVAGRHRDSDDIDKANFRAIWAALAPLNTQSQITQEVEHEDSVVIHAENNQTVGWIEMAMVHEANTQALEKAEELQRHLHEVHPILGGVKQAKCPDSMRDEDADYNHKSPKNKKKAYMDMAEQQALFESVEPGDTITMVNRQGTEISGAATKRAEGSGGYPDHWLADVGGEHPLMVTPDNIVRVDKKTARKKIAQVVEIDDMTVDTWFERDRAMAGLYVKDEHGDPGEKILEFWDEELHELVEDGFLDPRNWLQSLYAYAELHEILPEKEEYDHIAEKDDEYYDAQMEQGMFASKQGLHDYDAQVGTEVAVVEDPEDDGPETQVPGPDHYEPKKEGVPG